MKIFAFALIIICVATIVCLDFLSQGHASQTQLPALGQTNFPRDAWAFEGYTNPACALESALWAWGAGNLNQFQNSLSPEAQQREHQHLQQTTSADMVHEFRNVTGYEIVRQQLASDDSVLLHFHADGVNADKDARLIKVGNEWKLAAIP